MQVAIQSICQMSLIAVYPRLGLNPISLAHLYDYICSKKRVIPNKLNMKNEYTIQLKLFFII